MTTIAAVQGNGWAVVGWDSRMAVEGGRVYSAGHGSSKIVKHNGYLLGAAGDVRIINVLSYASNLPAPPTVRGLRLDKFITAKFIPALRDVFDREGITTKNETDTDSVVMVLVNATVYEIGGDWAWVRDASGLYAIGSGGDFALGALAMLDVSGVDIAKKSVTTALEVAARFDSGTAAPFHTASQLVLG
jgi:ATP-dependent protease HslVU (ClpYQ) peptidase subunit